MKAQQLESKKLLLYPVPIYEQIEDFINQWYTIVNKEYRTVIGSIGMVHAHPKWNNTRVQVIITEENRRLGYGLEALELLEHDIFSRMSYQRIAVKVANFNKPAIGLFKKAGYKLEGIQEQGYQYNDQYYDLILLRLLRHEYFQRLQKRANGNKSEISECFPDLIDSNKK